MIMRIKRRKEESGWSRVDGRAGLVWRETIGIEDALLGFKRKLRHLDGREVELVRHGVTQPGFVEVLEGEGVCEKLFAYLSEKLTTLCF